MFQIIPVGERFMVYCRTRPVAGVFHQVTVSTIEEAVAIRRALQ